jgi:magnesium transporter
MRKEIAPHELGGDEVQIGIVTTDEMETLCEHLGFSDMTLDACRGGSDGLQNSLSVYDDYSFGILDIIQGDDVLGARDKIGFFIKRNLFLIVDIEDRDRSTVGALEQAVERMTHRKVVTLERVIYVFLSRLVGADSALLERIERQIAELEGKVQDNETEGTNEALSRIRHELLVLRNYYEHLANMGEDLMENENGLFEEAALRYFAMFTDRATRLSNNVQMLRDYAAQVREAYQMQMDFNINNIMKVFTVVTAVFLPLTLVTGWYGMNFTDMPELHWRYGYLLVFLLCLVIAGGSLLLVKRKKWL